MQINNPGKPECQLTPKSKVEGHMIHVTCECGLDYLVPKLQFTH